MMIRRRVAFFVSSIALLGTLTFAVPAVRLPTSPLAAKKTLRVMTYNIHVCVGMIRGSFRGSQKYNAEHPTWSVCKRSIVGLREPKARRIAEWRVNRNGIPVAHNLIIRRNTGGDSSTFQSNKLITANMDRRKSERRHDRANELPF